MASPATAPEFTFVQLAELHESKTNPRRHFAGLDELTESVKQHGILTPLLVRPDGGQIGGVLPHYEIVAGARRYRAAKAAKIASVPIRILALTDEQALEFQVIENLQREDVHPLDEALGYQALLKAGQLDVAAIAGRVNKSERYVYQRMQLSKLIPEAQKAFLEEKITASHAELICRLQPKQQKDALAETERTDASSRGLRDWIEYNVHLDLGTAAFPKDDAGAIKSSQLVPGALACIDCPKRTGFNPALFPDVKKADTCTDPGCFHAKEKSFVRIQLGTHEKAKPLSAGSFYGEKTKGLTNWTKAGARKCKDTVEGVVVEVSRYHRDEKLGQVLNVCTNSRCKMHHPAAQSTTYSHKRSAKELAADKRRELEQSVRGEVEKQVVAKAWAKAERYEGNIAIPMRAIAQVLAEQSCGDEHAIKLGFGDKQRASIDRAVTGLDGQKAFALAVALCVEFRAAGKAQERLLAWAGINRKKLTAAAIAQVKKAPKAQTPAKKGTCRICRCTETTPCDVGIEGACSWTDRTQTLCSNPKCVKAAQASAKPAKKKAKAA